MQSDCIREASRACFNSCCVNPLLGLPHPHGSPPASASIASNPRRDFVSAILSSIQPNTVFTNHESLPSMSESLARLQNELPKYSTGVLADDIRAQEYYHLSIANHACFDYVGQGLYSYSQRQGCNQTAETASTSSSLPMPCNEGKTGVPFFDISYKSVNLHSCLMNECKESEFEASVRRRILRYMNLYEEDYSLVFTANQTSAFKLLADSYPFHSNGKLVTVYDYENEAVQTMIESARRKGARTVPALFSWPNLRLNSENLRRTVVNKNKPRKRGLFVFPLQSRMTGSRYSYQWMNLARENGWHILLDACALGAKEMETLGLSLFRPDFLVASFFKIFGENPSGFCCLIVKKSSLSELSQSSTSMGMIRLIPQKGSSENSLVQAIDRTPSSSTELQQNNGIEHDTNQKQPLSSEIEELDQTDGKKVDATIDSSIQFLGLDHADTLGLILISSRNRYITNWLVNALLSLKHPNSDNPLNLIRIFGPKIKLNRGPAVAFNVYDWKGERVDPILVQKLADRNSISLSCGVLRNIRFSENLPDKKQTMQENRSAKAQKNWKKEKHKFGIEVVSVWIGMLTNFEDVYRLWAFVSRFLDADFVEKERWRYTALNQTTVEV